MQEENLSFKISLTGTFWDRRPQFSVWLDDHVVTQSEIASSAEQIVSFERRVDEGSHTLKIRLENKTNADTNIKNGDVIDDISLGNLLWSAEYILDEKQMYQGKEIDHLDGCINLGWNGTYVLKFTSPFYIWLLEKL